MLYAQYSTLLHKVISPCLLLDVSSKGAPKSTAHVLQGNSGKSCFTRSFQKIDIRQTTSEERISKVGCAMLVFTPTVNQLAAAYCEANCLGHSYRHFCNTSCLADSFPSVEHAQSNE